MDYHVPVFLKEAIDALALTDGGTYIDATLGGGGHTREILKKITKGVVIGIDADSDAISQNKIALLQLGFLQFFEEGDFVVFRKESIMMVLAHMNYFHFPDTLQFAHQQGYIANPNADGMLFDLGVSSYQIDTPTKGFSYLHNGPLDMRMDARLKVQAKDLVNGLYEKELLSLLTTYGEEQYAYQIAKGIVRERKKGLILETEDLKKVIKKSVPFYYKNPYAKTFQALRIAVNGEIDTLKKTVACIDAHVSMHARLVFISFHSLEDRVIKQAYENNPSYRQTVFLKEVSDEEKQANNRSRSAKLRGYEKIA